VAGISPLTDVRTCFDLSVLAQTKWYEYSVRFAFGGAVTVFAGLIAKHFGPVLGGLFLAFPAIFPASATLVEKHAGEKKQRAGIAHTSRGKQAAALDAYGAAMGSVGLACFAVVVWRLLPFLNAPLVLMIATAVWLAVSMLIWRLRKSRLCHGR
jgi:Protein of unknown function (DUF3147)